MKYKVVPLDTGIFSGALDPEALSSELNKWAKKGWRLNRTIHEERKVLGMFKRESHFLVLERKRK